MFKISIKAEIWMKVKPLATPATGIIQSTCNREIALAVSYAVSGNTATREQNRTRILYSWVMCQAAKESMSRSLITMRMFKISRLIWMKVKPACSYE